MVKFADSVADLIFLSAFWVLGCIPVLTIGTSTTVLYYATMKSIRGEGSTSRNFLKSYKENLKQSVLAGLITLILAALMYIVIRAAAGIGGLVAMALKILVFVLFFLPIIAITHLFPLLSRFNQTVPNLFCNAVLIGFSNFTYTVAMIVLNMIPLLLFVIWPDGFMRLLLVLLFLAPGLTARINSAMLLRVFKKYTGKRDRNYRRSGR